VKLIEHFFRLLAPDECLNCGVEGSLLCIRCAKSELQDIPVRCYRCYRLSPGSKTCNVCRHHTVLKSVWIRTGYVQAAKKVVHELKFNFARDAARLIAREMATTLPVPLVNTVLVHVPATTKHIRHRGFDQSALIARELSHILNVPHVHALSRLGQQRQVGSTRSVRLKQMDGAFRVVSLHAVQNEHILLVDDVLTTGSTLESAAHALKMSGVKTVSAVCFAQAR
jgi:competence protein ComFC